jgi:hypothetical protein
MTGQRVAARTPAEMAAFWRRWRKGFVGGMVLLTAAIGLAWLVFGSGSAQPARKGLPIWVTLPSIYAIFLGYGFLSWRTAKHAFLSGKSADQALRARS